MTTITKTAEQPFWTPEDKAHIKSRLLGGAALGGGAALIVGLLNHLSSQTRPSASPETLKVVLPNSPEEDERAKLAGLLTGGIGLAAAAGGAGGSYYAVRKLIQALKKKELENEVQEAQSIYVDELSPKSANATDVMGIPVALLLASVMGSAGLTYKGLDKAFPAMRPDRPEAGAKRVEFVRDTDRDGAIEETDDKSVDYMTPSTKAATIGGMAYSIVKLAADDGRCSEFLSLVEAAANGRMHEISNTIRTAGVGAGLDVVKGAHCEDIRKCATAARALCADPIIGPAITLLAIAEMHEAAPGVCKIAQNMSAQDPVLMNTLCKIAVAVSVAETADHLLPQTMDAEDAQPGQWSEFPEVMDRLLNRNGDPT